jgi:hypothetical protein
MFSAEANSAASKACLFPSLVIASMRLFIVYEKMFHTSPDSTKGEKAGPEPQASAGDLSGFSLINRFNSLLQLRTFTKNHELFLN